MDIFKTLCSACVHENENHSDIRCGYCSEYCFQYFEPTDEYIRYCEQRDGHVN